MTPSNSRRTFLKNSLLAGAEQSFLDELAEAMGKDPIAIPAHLQGAGECPVQGDGETGVPAAVFGGEGGDGVRLK
jgi:hypothetical protein